MAKVWSLGWYVRKKDIDTDPNITTLFIDHDDEDDCCTSLRNIIDGIREIGVEVIPLSTEFEYGQKYEALKDSERTLLGNHNSMLVIGCTKGVLLEYIQAISAECGYFHHELSHGTKSFRLKDIEGTGTVYTGYYRRENGPNLFPCKYLELRDERLTIAKAYISYYDAEMDVVGPTIELFEVRSNMQGTGVGRKLVRFIERQARKEGFDIIYITDAYQGYSFFKKMGYTIEDKLKEEGWKYLNKY